MSSLNALKITKDSLEYNTDEKQNTVTTDIGTILLYAGTTINNISNNFLLCDGTSHEIADYPELFGIIGDKYGGTITHFNVPNFKAYIPIGSKEGVNTINYQGVNTISGGHNFIESSHFKHDHAIPTHTFLSELQSSGGDTNSGKSDRDILNSYSRVSSSLLVTTNTLDDNDTPITTQINHYPKYTTLNYIICYRT